MNTRLSTILRVLSLRKLVSFFKRIPFHISPKLNTSQSLLSSDINCKTISCRWRQLSKFNRHLIINLTIGFTIALVINYLHHSEVEWISSAENAAIDWVMSLQRGTKPPPDTLAYAFIDVDTKTYRHWGEPHHTPRTELLTLIKTASYNQARLIIVDFDLSRPSYDKEEDKALVDYLSKYSESAPPIIFIRTFRFIEDQIGAIKELRLSKILGLENIIETHPNLYWGSSLFNIDSDHKIRHWRLWDAVCNNENPQIILSAQLLTALLTNPQDRKHSPQYVANVLLNNINNVCHPNKEAEFSGNMRHLDSAVLSMYLQDDALSQRIIYTIPWILRENETYPIIETGNFNKVSLLSKRSALPILTQNNLDLSWIHDRITVIGASYRESRDLYHTPIGFMPGAMILINACHSLIDYGVLKPPSSWIKIIIELILITCMTFLFTKFDSFVGMLLSGTVVIVGLIPISFIFFKSGVWIDFAVPLVAVQIHEMVSGFEERFKQ